MSMRIAATSNPGRRAGSRTTLRWAAAVAVALSCVACASFQDRPPDPAIGKRLAEVQMLAGPSVNSFRYMRMSSFEPIGLQHLLVFTGPRDAFLLDLDAPCRMLDFGPFMGITSHMNRVMSGVDAVRVRDNPIPCRIVQIRPVDTARLRRVDAERKAQGQMEMEVQPSGAEKNQTQ